MSALIMILAFSTLLAFAFWACRSMFGSSAGAWKLLLCDNESSSPTLARIIFLVANISLALFFLVGVINSGGDPAALLELTSLFGAVDMPAVTGLVSGLYLWGKIAA